MVKEVNLRDTLGCTDSCQLIIDDKEVVLLKQGDDALINKSIDRLNRNLYTFNDKVYLHFRGSFGFCDFREYHFFNDNDRDLNLVEDLQSDYNRGEECIGYFTRSEIEKKFDNDRYDSIYIVDRNDGVLFASNKVDGHIIGKNIIPTDDEIVHMHFRNNDNTSKKKDISDIKGLKIYGPVKNSPLEFQHLFLTSKDGEFDVCWFKLKFICEDKFRLNYRTVPIYKLMMDEVLNYQSSFSEERYIKNNVGKQFLKRM